MLDGEGYISLWRHYRKTNSSSRGYEIESKMSMSNMNHENMIQLQKALGIGRIIIAKHKRECGIITVAHLYFNVVEQQIIIPKVLPYIMQKKERLEIMKEFLEYRNSTKKTNIPVEERELKYYRLEQQFEQALYRTKPWMLIKPVKAKGRPYRPVTPPKIIQYLV